MRINNKGRGRNNRIVNVAFTSKINKENKKNNKIKIKPEKKSKSKLKVNVNNSKNNLKNDEDDYYNFKIDYNDENSNNNVVNNANLGKNIKVNKDKSKIKKNTSIFNNDFGKKINKNPNKINKVNNQKSNTNSKNNSKNQININFSDIAFNTSKDKTKQEQINNNKFQKKSTNINKAKKKINTKKSSDFKKILAKKIASEIKKKQEKQRRNNIIRQKQKKQEQINNNKEKLNREKINRENLKREAYNQDYNNTKSKSSNINKVNKVKKQVNNPFNTRTKKKTNKKLTEKEIKKRKQIKKIKKSFEEKNQGLQKNIKHTLFNIKDNINREKNEVIFNDDGYRNPIKIKRFKVIFAIVILIFVALILRIAWIQFVKGNDLKEKADRQQTINKIISPKRGNIYDKNGVALALSASVDTVTINPNQICVLNNEQKTNELKEKVAKALSEIFEIDYNEVYSKVTSSNQIETIAKKVEHDKIEKLKNWMSANKATSGINIDEDNKRFYPYSTLAANLIGFTGTDNAGLEGIEAQWNSVLAGTSGKIVTSKDINDSEISSNNKQYVQAEDGSDIYLSIDVNIQSAVERVIAQYVNENHCDGGCGVFMNPKTGDILAMANYPSYDLNNPFTPNSALAKTWDGLSETARYNALLKMWRNKVVSNTYEPGSTFKVIVSAIALEENLVTTDKPGDFYCTGSEKVADKDIHCWKRTAHGYESLREALENSCNPAFMQLGKRVGVQTLYKYFEAFGLFDKTGIDTSGESSSVFFNENSVGPTELATMSFGQRFNITPIQLITAVSSIANNGKLVKPRIVKQVVSKDSTTNIDTVEVRQTVSEETTLKVKSMMQSVVENGTGKYGAVKGYSIGGKTGTSEPSAGKEEEGYTVSYVAISPVEDPEIVGLVIFNNPGGDNPEGGKIAGPAMSQILAEVLPYLGINNDSTEKVTTPSITVPDVTNKTISEAKKILENIGLTVKLGNIEDQNSELVKEQVPKAGASLLRNGIIKIYGNDNSRTSINIPNLKGKSLAEARNDLLLKNLNISSEGEGIVISQTPSYTSSVEEGTVIKVVLAEELKEAH